MNVKFTLLLEAAGGGFSETLYLVTADLSSARTIVESYLPVRRAIMPAGDADGAGIAKIVGFRLSDADNPKHFVNVARELDGIFKGGAQPGGSDMPWTGILLDLSTVNNTRRSFTVRGVPDDFVKNSYKGVAFGAEFEKPFQKFRSKLADGQFYVQALDVGGGNPLKTIASMTPTATGLNVTFAADHNLADGDLIRFNGVQSLPKIVGQYSVVVTDADQVLIPSINLGNLVFLSGKARKIVYSYDKIESASAVRKASRKAGRPFFLLRGRR